MVKWKSPRLYQINSTLVESAVKDCVNK